MESPNSVCSLRSGGFFPDLDVRVQPGKTGDVGQSWSTLASASLQFTSLFALQESGQSLLGLSNTVLNGFVDIATSSTNNAVSWEALLLDPLMSGPFDRWCLAVSVRSTGKDQKTTAAEPARSSVKQRSGSARIPSSRKFFLVAGHGVVVSGVCWC